MEFKQIKFTNCGPVTKGTITPKKINVFFGPNNSGKSIISRLIHGVNYLPTSNKEIPSLISKYLRKKKIKDGFYKSVVIRNSGINKNDLVTFGKEKSSIDIQSTKPVTLDFNAQQSDIDKKFLMLKMPTFNKSVYIPSSRVGIVQYFANIMENRNRLYVDLVDEINLDDTNQLNTISSSLKPMPEHLEQLSNLILGINADEFYYIQEIFSEVFPGSIELEKTALRSQIIYQDPTGHAIDLEQAGSGVISTVSILLGLHAVDYDGTLILEEPEANLDPLIQVNLINMLQTIAEEKNITLILNTNSMYIIQHLISMRKSKTIKPRDLGLYYFDNRDYNNVKILKINPDKVAINGLPPFSDAFYKTTEKFYKQSKHK